MKFLFDIFPVILFFIAFKFAGIYVATAIAIVATFAQIGWVWFRKRKIDTMLWVSLAVITVFGGATLLLHDETFIKWKPTVLYWLFGITLLIAELVFRKNLIKAMMGSQMELPDPSALAEVLARDPARPSGAETLRHSLAKRVPHGRPGMPPATARTPYGFYPVYDTQATPTAPAGGTLSVRIPQPGPVPRLGSTLAVQVDLDKVFLFDNAGDRIHLPAANRWY